MSYETAAIIKACRLHAGLTQRDLSKRSGVDHTKISLIENNKCNTSIDTYTKILDACGFELEVVLKEEDRI